MHLSGEMDSGPLCNIPQKENLITFLGTMAIEFVVSKPCLEDLGCKGKLHPCTRMNFYVPVAIN